jgi:hypothetical protein
VGTGRPEPVSQAVKPAGDASSRVAKESRAATYFAASPAVVS